MAVYTYMHFTVGFIYAQITLTSFMGISGWMRTLYNTDDVLLYNSNWIVGSLEVYK
jgi:hypothetical protein